MPGPVAGLTPERLAVLPQYLLPQRALTRLAGQIAGARGGSFTTGLIRWFVGRYGVNMGEAAQPDVTRYATFNDFFTRELAPGARPLAEADWLCPVDGAISQFGALDGERLFQAKGHDYTATALVGGDAALARQFEGGHFATLYLSPRDYHRIHMPCAGRLRRMIHVPGRCSRSTRPRRAACRGCLRATSAWSACSMANDGPFVLVLVGATIVGSMATTWHGVVNPPRPGRVRDWTYDDRDLRLQRGAEMGRFLLGSTVVLLFPPGPMAFNPRWAPGGAIRMGEAMAGQP